MLKNQILADPDFEKPKLNKFREREIENNLTQSYHISRNLCVCLYIIYTRMLRFMYTCTYTDIYAYTLNSAIKLFSIILEKKNYNMN
jgi:hypothetical protein